MPQNPFKIKIKNKKMISKALADELARTKTETVEYNEGSIDVTKVNMLRGVSKNSTVVSDDYEEVILHNMGALTETSKKKKKKKLEKLKSYENSVHKEEERTKVPNPPPWKPRRSARLRIKSKLNSLETIDFSEENVKIIRREPCNEMIKFLSGNIICHSEKCGRRGRQFVRNRGEYEYESRLFRSDINHVNVVLNCKNEEWQNITSSTMDDGCEGFMVNSVKFERVNDDQIDEIYEIHHGDFEPEENEFWRQNNDYIVMDMLFRESPFGDVQSHNLQTELIEEITKDKACIRESRGGESKNSVVMDDDYFKN